MGGRVVSEEAGATPNPHCHPMAQAHTPTHPMTYMSGRERRFASGPSAPSASQGPRSSRGNFPFVFHVPTNTRSGWYSVNSDARASICPRIHSSRMNVITDGLYREPSSRVSSLPENAAGRARCDLWGGEEGRGWVRVGAQGR